MIDVYKSLGTLCAAEVTILFDKCDELKKMKSWRKRCDYTHLSCKATLIKKIK